MKTHKLEVEYDYDFELFGIRSSEEMYRLAYLINRHIGTRFERSLIPAKYYEGKDSIDCAFFRWYDEQYDAEWNLISNRLDGKRKENTDTVDLFSGFGEYDAVESRISREHRQIDYFIQIFGLVPSAVREGLLEMSKEIGEIQAVIQLDVPEMRDRDNFLMIEYANKS